ncbi:enoyl-CoA hydratase-related protein [Ornithinimicrobium faecis]|uniref:Enoyl-CoA hydratase-related protein n=1 Tax=Ornithinimicrobium faecis TaxID=2934158 RepID=A0ABY4YQN7_9MICO|nr:enoyl-CoA hydratase-related protein [Ornithinimicrobium sp. HY1793]USQ79087.1 enoyl-CoA hydratase-related protein [Ornithinimicrobium sp. HY1793]
MANEVLVEVDGRGVATVTLNRPEVNNAYNDAMLRGLHGAIDAALASQRTDAPVRCVVIRGEGKHFQAGADLRWLAQVQQGSADENYAASELTGSAVRRLTELDVPVVVLVQGACFGGGTGILAGADVVICGEDSVFSIAEVKWGLHASVILPQLADAIGPRQVRRYALTGERFDAAEAQRIGLVHEAVARDDVPARGAEIVEAILSCGPGAVAITKRLARDLSWSATGDAEFADLVQEHSDGRQVNEAREGLSAFREKRTPAWVPAGEGS